MVAYQQGFWLPFVPKWNIFPQLIGFLVFLVAAFAETNRLPFDLPEAESELVAGYHTEYGGMRFALFFMGEYMAMAMLSALAATLYFGGWSLPGVDVAAVGAWLGGRCPVPLGSLPLDAAVAVGTGAGRACAILVGKIGAFMLLFVWVRWTFPRFRYDQLMRLGWKVLLPLALAQLGRVAALTLAGMAVMELAVFGLFAFLALASALVVVAAPQPGLLHHEPGGDPGLGRRPSSSCSARRSSPRSRS